ncbi:hypothetical protein NP493_557g01007 [Ridgeia piscesae]|uniref:Uncharacterized protein n=1 Tax=Ridgeia piscesae TaxID=27915 RepID=A0AAD9KWH6_RIDPI|nr:hypothetical protein NP493_557g01007 [Ridgeia piscesae]
MPSPKLRARKDDDRECDLDLVAGRNGDTRNDVRLWTLGKMGQVLRRLRDIKKKKGPTTPSDTGRTTLISGVEGARARDRARGKGHVNDGVPSSARSDWGTARG